MRLTMVLTSNRLADLCCLSGSTRTLSLTGRGICYSVRRSCGRQLRGVCPSRGQLSVGPDLRRKIVCVSGALPDGTPQSIVKTLASKTSYPICGNKGGPRASTWRGYTRLLCPDSQITVYTPMYRDRGISAATGCATARDVLLIDVMAVTAAVPMASWHFKGGASSLEIIHMSYCSSGSGKRTPGEVGIDSGCANNHLTCGCTSPGGGLNGRANAFS